MSVLNLNFLTVDISIDENVPYWTCNVTVSDYQDFELITKGDTFKINVNSEEWNFVVVSKSINRSNPESIQFSITGRSDTCLLTSPFRSPLHYILQVNKGAKDVVTELLDFRPIIWLLKDSLGYDLDWILEKYSLAENGSDRLSIAKKIIEAAGGVLECDSVGNFIVRPLFSISPLQYDTIVPDHSFSDVENIVTLSYAYNLESFYDYVRVRNTTSSSDYNPSDKMEFVLNNGSQLVGKLKVYPYPYRDINVETTADPLIINLDQSSKIEEFRLISDEVIDFAKGSANTSYPIHDIVSIVWQQVDLGIVTFDPNTENLYSSNPNLAYSTCVITYHTRCYTWDVVASLPGFVQEYMAQFLTVDSNVNLL